MEAKELRIGNLVYGVSDRIEAICELHTGYLETSFRGGLLNYSKYDDIQPIQLSDEWLKKFGIPIPYGEQTPDFRLCSYDWGYIVNVDGTDITKISYVHELQNLYYDLKRTDLTITL